MNPAPNSLYRKKNRRSGYTLIEVLAAAAIFAVGTAAACQMAGATLLQEELAWRTAIVRNYQENMVRVWQLGLGDLTSKDATTVTAVMPSLKDSPRLNEAFSGTPFILASGTTTLPDMGALEQAICTAVVNVNVKKDPTLKEAGASLSLNAYRASLPGALRKSL